MNFRISEFLSDNLIKPKSTLDATDEKLSIQKEFTTIIFVFFIISLIIFIFQLFFFLSFSYMNSGIFLTLIWEIVIFILYLLSRTKFFHISNNILPIIPILGSIPLLLNRTEKNATTILFILFMILLGNVILASYLFSWKSLVIIGIIEYGMIFLYLSQYNQFVSFPIMITIIVFFGGLFLFILIYTKVKSDQKYEIEMKNNILRQMLLLPSSFNSKISNESLKNLIFTEIGVCVLKKDKVGPEIIKHINPHYISNKDLVKINATIGPLLMYLLGQANKYHEGEFGPIPLPVDQDCFSLLSSRIVKDSNQVDKRLKLQSYTVVLLIFPKFLDHLITQKFVKQLFHKWWKTINDLSEITENNLSQLRVNLYYNLQKFYF